MFFKKEQVEQAKRMKIKLRTESSFERPETNSGMGHFYPEYVWHYRWCLETLRHGDPIEMGNIAPKGPYVNLVRPRQYEHPLNGISEKRSTDLGR